MRSMLATAMMPAAADALPPLEVAQMQAAGLNTGRPRGIVEQRVNPARAHRRAANRALGHRQAKKARRAAWPCGK